MRLNSVLPEATIRHISIDNLLKELVSASAKIGLVLTFGSIKTLPKTALIQRAIECRDKLKTIRKAKSFKVTADTSDDALKSLRPNQAMAPYVCSLRSRSIPVSKNELDQLPPEVIVQHLLEYQDSLFNSATQASSPPKESVSSSFPTDPPKDKTTYVNK